MPAKTAAPTDLTPAELLILREYRAQRELNLDWGAGASLTYSQRPPGHNGVFIRVHFYAARKAGERTGVPLKRVMQLLWKIRLGQESEYIA